MKLKMHFPTLIFFVFLLTSPQVLALVLAPKQEKVYHKLDKITRKDPLVEMQEENFQQLMGSENCLNEDEECFKRRMIAEAHLDYIYTQHERP